MKTQPAKQRIELSRHLALPVIFLAMLTVPWFLGGRDAFGTLVISLVAILLFASWLLVSRFQSLAASWRPRLVILPLALLLGWACLSLIWSVSRFESVYFLSLIITGGLIFVVARDIFRDLPARDFWIRIFVIAAGIVSAIGVGMYVLGDYERATSLFYWPNPLATYLIAALCFSLMLGRQDDTMKPDAWSLVSAVLGAGLILTFSRAGWLIMLLILGLMIWRSKNRRQFVIHLAVVIVIAVLLSVAASGARALRNKPSINVAGRVTESADSTSVSDRFSYWREGTVMFAERPILGWGVGTYKQVHPAYQTNAKTATNNPHNSLVQAFVELGAPGAVLVMLAIFGFVRVMWLARKKSVEPMVWAAQLAVIGIGLHSLLDLVTNYPVLIFLLAICLALSLPLKDFSPWEFRLKSWPIIVSMALIGLSLTGIFTYQRYRYLSNVDLKLIDAIGPLDPDRSAESYDDLLSRPIVEPAALSSAALFYVNSYDTSENPQKSDLDKALAYAERAVALDSQDARHYYALANVQQRLGKTTEALKNYRRAIELDPHNNPQYQVSLALLLEQQGFTREALAVLRPVADEYTEDVLNNRNFASNIRARVAIVYTVLARLESENRNTDQALRDIRRALELNPKYVPAEDLQKKLQAPAQ